MIKTVLSIDNENGMKRFFKILFLSVILFVPFLASAREEAGAETAAGEGRAEIIEAEVVMIVDSREIDNSDGSKIVQQNLRLKGTTGDWRNKDIFYRGITDDLQIIGANVYKKGDKVLVQVDRVPNGEEIFSLVGYVRRGPLYLLGAIFALAVIIVGGKKGLRSLLSLALTFLIILKFIIPRILAGDSPLLISIFGVFAILLAIIYLTEGFNRKSHIALFSIFISLALTFFLSSFFVNFIKLSGFVQEEAGFLVDLNFGFIDFKGLLLAGILIGAAGVLDDIVIGQVEAVRQIGKANPSLSAREVFRSAYKVGSAHLGAVINTLFLTYAASSITLLLLFSVRVEPFVTFRDIINNEAIATEIVRTLAGSVGLALAFPISTFLAVIGFPARKRKIIFSQK